LKRKGAAFENEFWHPPPIIDATTDTPDEEEGGASKKAVETRE
jgi:hypothetical protein